MRTRRRGELSAVVVVMMTFLFPAAAAHGQRVRPLPGPPPPTAPDYAGEDPRHASAAKRAVSDYHKLRQRHAHPTGIWRALSDLGHFDVPAIADLALEELDGNSVDHYPAARRLIADLAEVDSLRRVLAKGLGHDKDRVRAQVILALGEGRPSAVDWITPVEAALDDEAPEVRAAAVVALGFARARGRLDRILELAEDASVRVRQCVPESLVRLVRRRSVSLLRQLSQDPSWRVRSAVVRALGQMGGRPASEELVEIFDRETGRVREDAHRELKALAHVDFGPNVEAWRRFFLTSRTDSAGPEQEPSPTRTTAPVAPLSPVTYFGLPVLSRRLVLVVDVSSSMKALEKPLSDDNPDADPVTRLDLTKRELITLLFGFGPEVALDLVSFSDQAESWKGRLVPMDSRHRANARAEIRGFGPMSMTNLRAALAICFDMAQESLDDPGQEAKSPDTLYVLSDGGASNSNQLLLEYAAERNRELHLRIHCICLGCWDGAVSFMRDLAELTQGTYVNRLD